MRIYLVAFLEAGVRGLKFLEDLSVRVVEVTLKIVEARGSEILEIGHRCQGFSGRRSDEAGDAATSGALVEAPGLGLGGRAAVGAENE